MNAAYVMGARLDRRLRQYGFCTAIRGAEGGGKVGEPALHTFTSDDGDTTPSARPRSASPTGARRSSPASASCRSATTRTQDYAGVLRRAERAEAEEVRPAGGDGERAISSRLPYLMATSRFAHFLKVMARDKIGSFMEASDCEAWLNRWIRTTSTPTSAPARRARPLPAARGAGRGEGDPGQARLYNAVAYLQPWLQMEELTTSMRMVARIPQKA
jgi:type VI secretion system protein ImpC